MFAIMTNGNISYIDTCMYDDVIWMHVDDVMSMYMCFIQRLTLLSRYLFTPSHPVLWPHFIISSIHTPIHVSFHSSFPSLLFIIHDVFYSYTIPSSHHHYYPRICIHPYVVVQVLSDMMKKIHSMYVQVREIYACMHDLDWWKWNVIQCIMMMGWIISCNMHLDGV